MCSNLHIHTPTLQNNVIISKKPSCCCEYICKLVQGYVLRMSLLPKVLRPLYFKELLASFCIARRDHAAAFNFHAQNI